MFLDQLLAAIGGVALVLGTLLILVTHHDLEDGLLVLLVHSVEVDDHLRPTLLPVSCGAVGALFLYLAVPGAPVGEVALAEYSIQPYHPLVAYLYPQLLFYCYFELLDFCVLVFG